MCQTILICIITSCAPYFTSLFFIHERLTHTQNLCFFVNNNRCTDAYGERATFCTGNSTTWSKMTVVVEELWDAWPDLNTSVSPLSSQFCVEGVFFDYSYDFQVTVFFLHHGTGVMYLIERTLKLIQLHFGWQWGNVTHLLTLKSCNIIY